MSSGRANPPPLKIAPIIVVGIPPGAMTLAILILFKTDIEKDLGLSATLGTVALIAAPLIHAAVIMPVASLGDRLGRRKLFAVALLLGILGGAICFSAQSPALFIIGRLITGLGEGGVVALALPLLVSAEPPERLGDAIGGWVATVAGSTIGLLLISGMWIGNSLGWQPAFLVVPAINVVLLVILKLTVEETAKIRKKGNPLAMGVLGVGMTTLVLGSTLIGEYYANPLLWILLLVCLAAFPYWYFLENRSDNPTFPVYLLRRPFFILASLGSSLWLVAVSFYYLSIADLFQEIYGLSPAELTFWIVPMFAIGIATSLFVGKLLNSGGKPGVLIVVGLILSMVGFAITLAAGAELNFFVFVPATILLGAGPHVIAPAVMQVFVLEATPKSLGPVTSWHDITGQFGISLGIAGFSFILVAFDPVPLSGGSATPSPAEVSGYLTAYHDVALFAFAILFVGALASVFCIRWGRRELASERPCPHDLRQDICAACAATEGAAPNDSQQ